MPVLNEDPERLLYFIKSIKNRIKAEHKFEILLVDDGSQEKYSHAYAEIALKYAFIRIIKHPKNQGQIQAVNTGLQNSQGTYLICIDSDGEYCSDAVTKIFMTLKFGKDFVCGVRVVRNKYPVVKKMGSLFINKLFFFLNPLCNAEDFLCPVNGISRKTLDKLSLEKQKYKHFKLDILKHIKVDENIPIEYNHNDGETNYSYFKGMVFFIKILYEILHFSISSKISLTRKCHQNI